MAVYSRLLKHEEANLQSLRSRQKSKIEELKSSMNYYTTKSLIDRFEVDTTGIKSNSKDEKDEKTRDRSTVVSSGLMPTAYTISAGEDFYDEERFQKEQALQQQIKQMQYPSELSHTLYDVRESKWYDRILDVIMGEDETSPRNRYALICRACGVHNGLAPPGQEPRGVTYMCPHCGQWNPEEPSSDASVIKSNVEGDESVQEVAEPEVAIEDDSVSDNEIYEDKAVDSVPVRKDLRLRRSMKSRSQEQVDTVRGSTTGRVSS